MAMKAEIRELTHLYSERPADNSTSLERPETLNTSRDSRVSLRTKFFSIRRVHLPRSLLISYISFNHIQAKLNIGSADSMTVGGTKRDCLE